MGETIVKIKVSPLTNQRVKEVEVLADTGATYTVIPRTILESLEVKPVDRIKVRLADGRTIERSIGNVIMEIEGKTRATPIIFGEKEDAPILGLVTLEACGLTVDTVNKKLVPLPEIHHYFLTSPNPLQQVERGTERGKR